MTTVDEINSDKTKVPDEFSFRGVMLDCFTAELDDISTIFTEPEANNF